MNKLKRKSFIIIMFIIIFSFTCSATVFAVTGIYLGSGNVYYSNGDINYDVLGYVYYNSNTSTTLDVYSLCQWVYNNGVYVIDETQYRVHSGDFSKYTDYPLPIVPITSGNYRRMEVDWETVCYIRHGSTNTSYAKNSSEKYVRTVMLSGYSSAGLGGWSCDWFPSSRSAFFAY